MRILIKNGTVIDPANHVYSRQNLWIEDGKIAGYGDDLTMEASFDRVIDASGLVAVPGFIDIHMHEDPIDAGTGRPDTCISRCMLRMGVTTVLGGNCGINVYDPAEYLDRTDRYGMPVNIALMAGQTWAREKAGAADKYGPVSAAQLEEEKRILRGALDAGCFGVSFGIRYVPGLDRNELLETAGVCGREKHLISAHVRDDAAQIFGAVEEFLDIGRTLGLRTQVSHVGSMGGYGQMKELLAILDRERAMGLDVLCDCYPYYAFSTRIGETTYDDGFLERYRADYSCIELCEGPYKGMRCTEAIFNELRENAPETITVGHVMKPEDVDLALLHPGVMLASDGLMDAGQGHPRAAGTFPRFIDRYVKTGKLTLFRAVEKMTAMPAGRLGLTSQGHLGVGADADIVLFDPETIKDNATFSQPDLPPDGIEYVLIGGKIAARHGTIVDAGLGKAVRKL